MKFTVVTILPELIEPSLTAGVVGRAREAGVITVRTINPRDFTHDKHRTVDDTPYGGGPGMVMKAEPLLAAIERAGSDVLPPGSTPPAGSAPRARSEDGLPGDPDDILSTGRFDRASLRELADADDADIMTTGRFTRPSMSDLAKVAVTKSDKTKAGEEEATRRANAAREGTPTDAHGDALDDAAAQRALALEGADHGEHDGELITNPRMQAVSLADIEGASSDLLDDAGAQRALAELEGKPASNDLLDDAAAQRALAELEGTTTTADKLDDAAAQRALDELEKQARDRQLGLDRATLKREDVRGSLANVDDSIGKLEGALGGHLDALAPKPPPAPAASPAATSSSPTATPTTSAKPHRILLSPSGKPLTQARVRELAKLEHLILVCGRYEGIDQRVIDTAIDEELSIGDYVLSGGELGALVIIDAVARYVPGVLGEATSVDDESFSAGLLEYPQYTKPAELRGKAVPPVLTSGNHALVAAWRRDQAMRRTAARRPDLYRSFQPTKADAKSFPPLRGRTHLALVHHPVVDRTGAVVTTALTNFDIHDLARSSMTFGLAGYHIVTPITSQREKAQHIAELWIGDEQGEHRARALRLARTADTIDAVIQAIKEQHGLAPRVVATSAKPTSFPAAIRQTSTELLAESTLDPAPLLILLGTGWGLADHLIPSVSRILAPIEGASDWNHLSVRSAGAVILDRLFGRPA